MTQILSIGSPLPNFRIDNHNVFNAPSMFDFEAAIIDPLAFTADVSALLSGAATYEGRDGRPVVNGASTADAVGASELLKRRGEEAQRMLDSGGTLIVFARPNATVHGLVGFEGADRYSWLPAPAGMHWGPPALRAAEGITVRVIDDDHVASGFLRDFRKHLAYRAIFDDRLPAFRAASRVIATGGANTPIAVEFEVLSGRVVFIPALADSANYQRSEIAEALTDVIRELQTASQAGESPYWLNSVPLPGIEDVETSLTSAKAAVESAGAELATVQEKYDELDHHRRILWDSGPGLQNAVIDAFRMLGFEIERGDEGIVFTYEGETFVVETEGSREQVVEWPYVRLQRRLEERMLKRGESLKGLIVANGHRLTAPEGRPQQFTDALRIACENYRYGLMTGTTVFALVRRVLEGASDADLLGIRRRITSAAGELDLETAVGERDVPAPNPLF